jgi:hypothetical protein
VDSIEEPWERAFLAIRAAQSGRLPCSGEPPAFSGVTNSSDARLCLRKQGSSSARLDRPTNGDIIRAGLFRFMKPKTWQTLTQYSMLLAYPCDSCSVVFIARPDARGCPGGVCYLENGGR